LCKLDPLCISLGTSRSDVTKASAKVGVLTVALHINIAHISSTVNKKKANASTITTLRLKPRQLK
jgi:hypothetical protein